MLTKHIIYQMKNIVKKKKKLFASFNDEVYVGGKGYEDWRCFW